MSDRLQEIKERCEKATPGPWELVLGHEDPNDACVHVKGSDNTVCYTQCYDCNHRADMAFIAHAREDIPYLLDENDRLRRELERKNAVREAPDEEAPGIGDS